MYLSNSQRIAKVILQLTGNPSYLIPYLRYSLTNRSPLELELPWWSLKAIRTLEKHLKKEHRVFEWGSGGSTIFLAARCKEVTSIEDNPEWVDKVEKALKKRDLANARLLPRELRMQSQEEFKVCPYAKAIDSPHDLIVIDGEDSFGPEVKWSARESCFEIAEEWIVKPGGIILVDDSWRYPVIRENSHAVEIVVHESIGPCRKGVTSTDLHYY